MADDRKKKWYNSFVTTSDNSGNETIQPADKNKKWYEGIVTVTDKSGNETIQSEDKPVSADDDVQSLGKRVQLKGHPVPESEKSSQFILTDDFHQIYKAAEIEASSHGYDIYKIMELLEGNDLKSVTADVKRCAILTALKITKVDINDIIKDAVARDKALDGYEKLKLKSIDEFEEKKKAENQALETEIEEYLKVKNELIDSNKRSVGEARSKLANWQKLKQAEEQKIYDAITPFVSSNPVTLSKPTN
jgi:hypothetical protein